ncbi:MAG: hypothetical protein AAF658_11865, partial [Myxococcota bacterium]
GEDVTAREFTMPSPDGQPVRQLQVYRPIRGEMVMLVATASSAGFEQWRPTFLAIAASLDLP